MFYLVSHLKSDIVTVVFVADEAPLTCEMFVEEGGMQIFMRILEVCVHVICWIFDFHYNC